MFVNEFSALFVKRLWGLIKPPTLQLLDSEQVERHARQLEKLGHHAIKPFALCKVFQTHCLSVRTRMG